MLLTTLCLFTRTHTHMQMFSMCSMWVCRRVDGWWGGRQGAPVFQLISPRAVGPSVCLHSPSPVGASQGQADFLVLPLLQTGQAQAFTLAAGSVTPGNFSLRLHLSSRSPGPPEREGWETLWPAAQVVPPQWTPSLL